MWSIEKMIAQKKHSILKILNVALIVILGNSIPTLKANAYPINLPNVFPVPIAFRAAENAEDSKDLARLIEAHAPYPVMQVNGFDVDKPNPLSRKLHERWPNKILIVQRAYGGVGTKEFPNVWPGHLLYKAGTLLMRDILPQDQVIEVQSLNSIANNKTIKNTIKKANKDFPYGLVIYALDKMGKPDWSQAEHVIVDDIQNGKLIVERGQWGSKPLSFKAGKAVVAAHMMYWTKQWQLNLSMHCPRGGQDNLTAAEWYAREMDKVVRLSKADGIEFDVGRWTWGHPHQNPMDSNNDLLPDYGYIDGVNSFGIGGQVFFRELRNLLGPDKIIQADSNSAAFGVRGWKYINGVQLESFPLANDFDLFSQAFLHLRLWVENAEAMPHFSYPFTKTPTTVFTNAYLPNGAKTDFRFRVGLAAACLVGMPHPFANLISDSFDPENPALLMKTPKMRNSGIYNWDEYHAGDLNDWQWLGTALNTAQQDFTDLNKVDLLARTQWQWSTSQGFAAESHQEANSFSTHVQMTPQRTIPKDLWFGVRLEPKTNLPQLILGREYTLEFEARGDDFWHYAGQEFAQVPRMVVISGAITSKNGNPLSVLVDSKWRTYRISFNADSSRLTTPVFGTSEQIGKTEIRNIKLYAGSAERWYRQFEKGLVLLNMTNNPWSVVAPKGKYKRLKGKQAPEINTGGVINNEVIVPAHDALFLIKR
jgi:hypothetical protein